VATGFNRVGVWFFWVWLFFGINLDLFFSFLFPVYQGKGSKMANFRKHSKKVHAQVLMNTTGKVYELGLRGAIDKCTMTELAVSISFPNPSMSIKQV
jgi:hypothetical protein